MAILEQLLVPGARSGMLERIRSALLSLSPAERRVAERILAEPAQAINLSISEFAALCAVAQPTVSKVCRSIGVSSYAALRLGLTNDFAVKPPDELAAREVAVSSVPDFAQLVTLLGSTSDLHIAARALRTATHVEVWCAPDFASAGSLLSDQLIALTIPISTALVPTRWSTRTTGFAPGTIVVLLAPALDETIASSLSQARAMGARVLGCTVHATKRFAQDIDWLVHLPENPSLEFVGLALVEALLQVVRAASEMGGPAGPASPWRAWPHVRSVFLPTDADPIPCLLLVREEPPEARPLVIYFSGICSTKENALPGLPNNPNPVCPKIVASLLNAGYHVLVVDAQAHGDRKRGWQETWTLLHESFTGTGDDFLAAARQEASYLVDGVLALGVSGDDPRVAVIGQSWGGLQSLLTLVGDTRLVGGVGMIPLLSIASLFGFTDMTQIPRVATHTPGAWMGSYLAPRPLLLLIGDSDEIAPPHYAETFIEDIRPVYQAIGAEEHLEWKRFPDLGHRFDVRLVEATLAWLDRYLPLSSTVLH